MPAVPDTARSSAAPWSEAPYPPGGCSALEADSAARPLSDPGAGLGVLGSHQVGSRIPPHHWGKLPKPLPVSRPADEPAFLLPSSRQGPGGLSLRGSCEPTAGPRSDQARSHPPTRFPLGIPVHGHLLGPGGLRTPEGAGPAEPHAPSPLSKSISSSVCCTPGAALGWEQQGPSAQGRGAAMSLSAPALRLPGAGTATGRPGRGLGVPARSDPSASARTTGPTNQTSESGPGSQSRRQGGTWGAAPRRPEAATRGRPRLSGGPGAPAET